MRKRRHSSSRIPLPYSSPAISRQDPSSIVSKRDFLGREHHGNAPRPLGAHQILHPGQPYAQNLAIQEQQCRQRLILRAGRHLAPRRQFGEKRLYFY
jgi:hypothetical protein